MFLIVVVLWKIQEGGTVRYKINSTVQVYGAHIIALQLVEVCVQSHKEGECLQKADTLDEY